MITEKPNPRCCSECLYFKQNKPRMYGQCRVNKDFNPSACMGRKFFKIFQKWDKLSKEEKLDTLIFG
jgi:hypothetical protein